MEHKSILLLIFFRIYVASAIFQSYFAEKTNLWYCSDETENTGPLAPQAKSLTNKPPLMSFDFHNHAEQVATWNRHSQSLSSIFFALCVTMLILSCALFLIFIYICVSYTSLYTSTKLTSVEYDLKVAYDVSAKVPLDTGPCRIHVCHSCKLLNRSLWPSAVKPLWSWERRPL